MGIREASKHSLDGMRMSKTACIQSNQAAAQHATSHVIHLLADGNSTLRHRSRWPTKLTHLLGDGEHTHTSTLSLSLYNRVQHSSTSHHHVDSTHLLGDGDQDVARVARHAEAGGDERRQEGLLLVCVLV